jgi:hypothetical protein
MHAARYVLGGQRNNEYPFYLILRLPLIFPYVQVMKPSSTALLQRHINTTMTFLGVTHRVNFCLKHNDSENGFSPDYPGEPKVQNS